MNFKFFIVLTLLASFFYGCNQEKGKVEDWTLVNEWADMTLYLSKNTPANSPTYASRAIGYIGLTMYESVVHGFPDSQSLAGQLNGLEPLPLPEDGEIYDWQIAFSAAQAEILKGIYMQTSDENKLKIDSLERRIERVLNLEAGLNERSKMYGKSVAKAIYDWSMTDGGHRGYLHNFDKEIKHEEFPGSWKPPLFAQSFSHHPLHPYWGENRTFLIENAALETPEIIAFDSGKGSDYYKEFLAVYEKEQSLTQAEKEAALWWGDDPDDTFTPPGHSFYLTTLAVEERKPNIIEASAAYAKVGLSVADAFINCWKWKYHFFSERPNTFIPKFIDAEWESFWPDPPFPSFPSGHAIQAAAAATSLGYSFTGPISFIDSSHIGRKRDELRNTDFKPRSFNSFWDVALETADSRFYGGIHTPQDNKVGLTEGKRIAENVNNLKWKRSE
jgi:hypothetical protein